MTSIKVDEEYQRALSLIAQGEKHKGFVLLQNIVIADPEHVNARNDLGVLFFELGDYELALRNLEIAAALNPGDPAVAENLAQVKCCFTCS